MRKLISCRAAAKCCSTEGGEHRRPQVKEGAKPDMAARIDWWRDVIRAL